MRRILRPLAMALIGVLVFAGPALAFLTNPDSLGFGTYSNNTLKVFRNLAETGDSLYVFHYNIPYTGDYPDEPASDTIVFRLYDDADDLKASFAPYNFPYLGSNGYGNGIASIYFAAADDAPAWGSAAVLTMDGWPAYFTGLTPFTYTLTDDDYITYTSQEDNREALKEFVMILASRLESIYSATGIILRTSSDSGEVLSSYGETYFGGTIPGLNILCPDLFFIQVYVPERMETTYNMTMADTYGARYAPTEWAEGFTNLGEGLGVSGQVMAVLVVAALCAWACIWTIRKDWGIEAGAAISVFIGIGAALIMGTVLFALLMIISLIAVFALVWLLGLRRVG